MEFFRDTQLDFMKYRKVFVVVSALLLLAGFVEAAIDDLNVGIDFAGGTQLTVIFQEEPQIDELRSLLGQAGLTDASLQRFGEANSNEVLIKTSTVAGTEEGSREDVVAALDQRYNQGLDLALDLNRTGADALAEALTQADPDNVAGTQTDSGAAHYAGVAEAVADLKDNDGLIREWDEVSALSGISPAVASWLRENATIGKYAVVGIENVGPQMGKELRLKGFLAVISALVGMMIYIWLRFELRFGIGAVVATIHDVGITLGLFAIAGFEFNLTTIAAFLTLVGYSVNDTVVVFDRVRENMGLHRRKPMVELMNLSINQTLSRTILTSGTTLLTVASLFFLGGDVLRGFSFVLLVGIIVGTYSSIFIACPFTLLWEKYFGSDVRSRRREASAAKRRSA
jgi:preprotein translocase subunit SecF